MLVTQIKIGAVVLLVVGVMCEITGLGGQASAQTAPVTKEEQSRTKQPAAANEVIRFAQLGQKREQLIARFGEPKNVTTFASGIESLTFQNGDNRMLIEIAPTTQQVIQIYYRKQTPFTDGQIMELLNRNAEGQRWIPAKDAGVFIRSDGGMARGCRNGLAEKDAAKFGDEFQFAVLSGSEVVKNKPAVAAAWKQEVEDALKELEGF